MFYAIVVVYFYRIMARKQRLGVELVLHIQIVQSHVSPKYKDKYTDSQVPRPAPVKTWPHPQQPLLQPYAGVRSPFSLLVQVAQSPNSSAFNSHRRPCSCSCALTKPLHEGPSLKSVSAEAWPLVFYPTAWPWGDEIPIDSKQPSLIKTQKQSSLIQEK